MNKQNISKISLQDIPAKRCHTVAGWLVHNGKVLLVRHKMLNMWLAPGGHVETNELPHRAAEREFLEETGLKVRAISAFPTMKLSDELDVLPLPFIHNLHWINRPGEKKARSNGDICEQHYLFGFFVEAVGKIEDVGNSVDLDDGVDDVRWFSLDEIDTVDTHDGIKIEAKYAFAHHPNRSRKS